MALRVSTDILLVCCFKIIILLFPFFHSSVTTASPSSRYQCLHITEEAIRARAKAAILGSFVADAATSGLHWVYNLADLDAKLAAAGKTETPEFFEPSANPFYQHPTGALSIYGDENLVLLQSVAKNGGLDPVAFTQDQYEFFKVYPSYLNKASKAIVANVGAGKQYPDASIEDAQVNCLVKAPVVTALYAGTPLLKEKIGQAVLAHQNSPIALTLGTAGALILEQVILGSSIQEALDWASQPGNIDDSARGFLSEALAQKDSPHTASVDGFGKSCALPGSFKAPIHNFAVATSFADGVRKTISAGGDNCGRVNYIGAVLGAAFGVEGIPQDWKDKTTLYSTLESLADKIVALRSP